MNKTEDHVATGLSIRAVTGALQADLDALVDEASAASTYDTSFFVKAEVLLSRVKDSPPIAMQEENFSGSGLAGGWRAICTSSAGGEQNVICSKEQPQEISLEGDWTASARSPSPVRLLSIRIGDRVWAMRETEHGPSYIAADLETEGRGDKLLFEELQQRASQAREPAHPPILTIGWVCLHCNWPNQEASVCQMCHAPKTPGAQSKAHAAPLPKPDASARLGSQPATLPSWIDAAARFDRELELPPGLQETVSELTRWSGAAVDLFANYQAKKPLRCVKCDTTIPASSRFCTKCGAEQRHTPSSGPETLNERAFLKSDATRTSAGSGWQCAKCRQPNPKQANFCMNCAAPAPRSEP